MADDQARIASLERAVATLADVLEETITMHGIGWTHWRAHSLQARVAAARALIDADTITLPSSAQTGPRHRRSPGGTPAPSARPTDPQKPSARR